MPGALRSDEQKGCISRQSDYHRDFQSTCRGAPRQDVRVSFLKNSNKK